MLRLRQVSYDARYICWVNLVMYARSVIMLLFAIWLFWLLFFTNITTSLIIDFVVACSCNSRFSDLCFEAEVIDLMTQWESFHLVDSTWRFDKHYAGCFDSWRSMCDSVLFDLVFHDARSSFIDLCFCSNNSLKLWCQSLIVNYVIRLHDSFWDHALHERVLHYVHIDVPNFDLYESCVVYARDRLRGQCGFVNYEEYLKGFFYALFTKMTHR